MAQVNNAVQSSIPLVVSGKRKRGHLDQHKNYEELNAFLEETFDDGEESISSDEDGTYGKRSKVTKRLIKKARKANAKKEKAFPFMELPAELRQQIYELALLDDEIILNTRFKNYRRQVYREQCEPMKSLVPNLLAVNKQIRTETIGILYQQPIIVNDTMTLHDFLAAIGSSHRRVLTDITVKGWGWSRGAHKTMNYAGLTLLADCVNLKSLHLDCAIAHMRAPKQLARQIFRDGSHFLWNYGSANRNPAAALKVLKLADYNYDKNDSRAHYWAWRADNMPDAKEHRKEFDKEMRRLLRAPALAEETSDSA